MLDCEWENIMRVGQEVVDAEEAGKAKLAEADALFKSAREKRDWIVKEMEKEIWGHEIIPKPAQQRGGNKIGTGPHSIG